MSLWAFQKAKNYQNLKTENGSKQRFILLQENVVIQAVCLRTEPGFKPKRKGYVYLGIVRKCQQPQTNTFWFTVPTPS